MYEIIFSLLYYISELSHFIILVLERQGLGFKVNFISKNRQVGKNAALKNMILTLKCKRVKDNIAH